MGTIEKEQCFLFHEKKQKKKQHYSPSTLEAKLSIGNRMNVSAFRDLWARVMF